MHAHVFGFPETFYLLYIAPQKTMGRRLDITTAVRLAALRATARRGTIPCDAIPLRPLLLTPHVTDDRALRDRFGALFRQFYPELCSFVGQYVRSRAVAEELVQDLFLRLWERRVEWQGGPPSRSYLYQAARNRAFDHLKRLRIAERSALELVDDDTEPPVCEAVLDAEDLRTALQRAIERLPPRTREVFVLSKGHGLTYPQIAEALAISVKTVESQMTRAFRLLRGQLAQYL